MMKEVSDPLRLTMLRLIARGRECCDSASLLKEAGLVEETGCGRWTLYSLNRQAFRMAVSGIADFVLQKEGSCCE